MEDKKDLTFEDSLKKLENCTDSLKNEDINLEDAINNFQEGMEYYNYCKNILEEAKQKIEIYSDESEA